MSVLPVSAWRSLSCFQGYERWLVKLEQHVDVDPSLLAEVLGVDHVRFVIQQKRLPAGIDQSDVEDSYVGLCARGLVPTRPGSVHDLLNALVWARFPQAKRALSERQLQIARGQLLPPQRRVRTPEQDALAMLDEGGVLQGPHLTAVFGHAILEDAIRGRTSRPRIVVLEEDDLDSQLVRHLQASPRSCLPSFS